MGSLQGLKDVENTVHLIQTQGDAGIIDIYVYDILKERCKAGRTSESIIEVNSAGTFKTMLELVNMQPYLAEKWLFVVEYKKVSSQLKKHKALFLSDTSMFLVKVDRYADFKAFKELYPKVNDLYLSVIRYNDIRYLLKGCEIPYKLLSFIASSYYLDPEKVFEIKQALEQGLEVATRKQVVGLVGMGVGSVDAFAMSLLKDFPTTEKGMKTVYRNRIQVAREMAEIYGVRSFRNFLMSSVRNIMYVKQIYMNADIYDRVRDIPDCFDEKQLSRLNKYLERIKEVPYGRIVGLLGRLSSSSGWDAEVGVLEFIYGYYNSNYKGE